MQGKIMKGIAGFYYVYAENHILYECKARGLFRKENQKPLVGDNVEIEILDEQEEKGNIVRLLPRKNSLIRPAVANVDQALVIFAAENPKPNYMLLDRFLITMERQQIPVIICFNKIDLAKEEDLLSLEKNYIECGYQILLVSASEEKNLEKIKEILNGKTTVVAGPSGVGKSTITNHMQQDVYMETGEISKKLGRGRHTTRHSQIIPVDKDSFIVDTPGFSSLYVEELEKEELQDYFPEFYKYRDQCKFLGCMHIQEPSCAVKDALEKDEISKIRYENYRMLYEELKTKRRY